MVNKATRIRAIIVLILGFIAISFGMRAQNVVLKGKTFVQVDSTKSQGYKTGYEYVDKNHISHPVYLSRSGKAFIIVKSSKTGKEYRRYLPKVTQMLKEINK